MKFKSRASVGALVAAAMLSFSGMAQAEGFSAMVSDVETGAILTADQIDAPRSPALMSRLSTITMVIQDLADGTLKRDEKLQVRIGEKTDVITALQSTALGEGSYRAPMTALSARVGLNAQLFDERLAAIRTRVGMQASRVSVVRGADGGPAFEGQTTLRDTLRLATSLVRAHGAEVDEVFGPATGGLMATRLWMSEDSSCLLVARGPETGRDLAAALTGAPSAAECFDLAADMLSEGDQRLLEASEATAN